MKFFRGSLIGLLAVVGATTLGPWSGGSAIHQPVHDLATTAADVTILGVGLGDVAGDAVVAGDFNGDGIEDLLVGAPFSDGPGTGTEVDCGGGDLGDRCAAGEAYVILGSSTLPATIDLFTTSPALTVVGADPGDRLGFTLTSGNFNGDGYDDLVLSAHSADGPGAGICPNNFFPGDGVGPRCTGGQVYVIYGSATLGVTDDPLSGTIDLNTPAAMAVTIYGADTGDLLGRSMAAADLDGDGKDDLILGAPLADGDGNAESGAGEVYVIRGVHIPFPDGEIDLADVAETNLAVTIYGAETFDVLGYSAAAGDFDGDGDGKDDLLLGAPLADAANNEKSRAGEVYFIRGDDLPAAGEVIDLADVAETNLAVTIYGADVNDRLGQPPPGKSLAAGDLNGDGIDDLILGAERAQGPEDDRTLAGEAYVILGGNLPAAGTPMNLDDDVADLTVYGADGDRLGLMLAAGDFNDDGFDDLVVGVRFADGPGLDSGEAYVILGPRSGTIDLAMENADLKIIASEKGDHLGISATVGDFDGDDREDLVLAAPSADGEGAGAGECPLGGFGDRCSAGEVYVFGLSGSTPIGGGPVSLGGGLGSPGGVEITFENVTSGGTTTLTTSPTGEPPPTGLKIVGFRDPVYYEITTTATFTGLVTVCIAYDETLVQAEGQEANLKLHHDDGSGFTDITSSLDTINNIICGETATLSSFALMVPISPSVGGIVELVAGPSDSADAQQPGRGFPLELAALAVALAAVAGVYWHRYRRRA